MKCLRSGYCCIHLDVVIVNDPALGIAEDNLIHKATGVVCKHLRGSGAGHYACSIHAYEWFADTPCAAYTQIGHEDAPCRMGAYILQKQ